MFSKITYGDLQLDAIRGFAQNIPERLNSTFWVVSNTIELELSQQGDLPATEVTHLVTIGDFLIFGTFWNLCLGLFYIFRAWETDWFWMLENTLSLWSLHPIL